MNETEIPRRNQINRWTAAERAIQAAVEEVEGLGADVRLTDAVVLLGEARQAVADYVDGLKGIRRRVELEHTPAPRYAPDPTVEAPENITS